MINDRLKEIYNTIDRDCENISINDIINKYNIELKDYTYIESEDEFINLKLKGAMRYVNKYDGNLRYGGLVIKIYKKLNNTYAIIKKISGQTYTIGFNNNHIFYMDNKNNMMCDWLKCFISDVDAGKYILE